MSEAVVKELSEFLSNQIAAGEVVLRPASVVKELMENSIDGKAQMVIVNIKEGGIDMIQVVDDGVGMCHGDALMCFNRHATSKISSVEDLFAIRTFGFRGEALPSIASIAEVSLKCRREDDEVGTEVEINGGKLVAHHEAVCAKGTQVVVKNLFYNIPARRKFLKSARAEQRHIEGEFVRVALCYPRTSFFLHADGKCIYNLPTSNLRQRVNYIAGKTVGAALMELHVDTSIVEIKGYIGHPKSAKKSAAHYMFVNGRYFSHRGLHKAVQQAYSNLLPSGDMVPAYFLYFDIAPDRIDVNVSPGKSEVKFDDEQSIWQILTAAVRESLGKNGIVPMIDFDSADLLDIPLEEISGETKAPVIDTNPMFNPFNDSFSFARAVGGGGDSFRDIIQQGDSEPGGDSYTHSNIEIESHDFGSHDIGSHDIGSHDFESSYIPEPRSVGVATNYPMSRDLESNFVSEDYVDISFDERETTREIEFDSRAIDPIDFKGAFTIGDRYIVAKVGSSMAIIDASRALYRIRYDAIIELLGDDNSHPSQALLFPRTVPLSMGDYPLVMDSAPVLERAGFLFTGDADSKRIEITAIPSSSSEDETEQLLEEIISSLKDETMATLGVTRSEKIARSLARISGKLGGALDSREIAHIIESLKSCENINYTPDGQSIINRVSLDDIVNKFKR